MTNRNRFSNYALSSTERTTAAPDRRCERHVYPGVVSFAAVVVAYGRLAWLRPTASATTLILRLAMTTTFEQFAASTMRRASATFCTTPQV